MPKSIRTLSKSVRKSGGKLDRSHTILKFAHDSAKSFLAVFDTVRKQRAPGASTTTDEEQDILRAMLLFAAAGLDALLKQLIADCLPSLAPSDEKVADGLRTFTARSLRRQSDPSASDAAPSFLSRIHASPDQYQALLSEYVSSLTGGSLQSPEELMRALFALGVDPGKIRVDPTALRPIFDARNKISHELDIDFQATRRNRRSRARDPMVEDTNTLLQIAEAAYLEVEAKVSVGP